jgi:hypothetical protein
MCRCSCSLLEYAGVEFDLDVDEINDRWEELAAADQWSHMIIKHTDPTVEHIDVAPPTGRYVLDAYGRLAFSQGDLDWHLLGSESESFFLRIYGPATTVGRARIWGSWSPRAGCRRPRAPVHPREAPHRVHPGDVRGHAAAARGGSTSTSASRSEPNRHHER